jgi:phosphoglycerate dehydrogenase-like enzyme
MKNNSNPSTNNGKILNMNIAVVGWHSHNEMFDAIGAELQGAGHRIVRHADSAAFSAARDPLAGIDLLLCVAVFPITRAMITSASRLRAIVSAIAGIDGIDLTAATECGVVVANAQSGESIAGMAEATVLMVLAALYDFNGAQDRIRQKLWRPPQLKARQLHGKTIGFVGLGTIGREIARLLGTWGARMQYCARRDADPADLPPMQRVDLDGLMRTSDVVLVLASLNDETRGLLSAEKLRLMKKTAILVNTARGSIIDEFALSEALKSGAIAGAALDCFAVEPLTLDSPLRELPNAILTPHTIGHTVEARHSLGAATRENLSRIIAGQAPRYVVNTAVLPTWREKWGA